MESANPKQPTSQSEKKVNRIGPTRDISKSFTTNNKKKQKHVANNISVQGRENQFTIA
jgi:hypothetical protein